jgi:DNA-directed RNA polymerase specialized sigma24 family protein
LEQGVSIVERTLLGLPARCRQVFLLRVSHEMSYEAIAERLGLSKRTVEREMQQALEACEQNLKTVSSDETTEGWRSERRRRGGCAPVRAHGFERRRACG